MAHLFNMSAYANQFRAMICCFRCLYCQQTTETAQASASEQRRVLEIVRLQLGRNNFALVYRLQWSRQSRFSVYHKGGYT